MSIDNHVTWLSHIYVCVCAGVFVWHMTYMFLNSAKSMCMFFGHDSSSHDHRMPKAPHGAVTSRHFARQVLYSKYMAPAEERLQLLENDSQAQEAHQPICKWSVWILGCLCDFAYAWVSVVHYSLQWMCGDSIRYMRFSPPARWGLLDFMSVAFSCLVLLLLRLLLLVLSSSSSSSSLSNCDQRSTMFSAGPQPRPSTPSVPCRTSTTTIHAQCSLPGLNHDHPRPVFPAGPQPRPSTPSVPCRTSTASIHAQCSLPDLNREYPRQVFPAGPHVGRYGTKNVQKKVKKNVRQNVRRYARRCAR